MNNDEWVNTILRKAIVQVELMVMGGDGRLRIIAGPSSCTEVRMNAIRAIATHHAGKTQDIHRYADVIDFIAERIIWGESLDTCIDQALMKFWN